jgi:hypothetical protein
MYLVSYLSVALSALLSGAKVLQILGVDMEIIACQVAMWVETSHFSPK